MIIKVGKTKYRTTGRFKKVVFATVLISSFIMTTVYATKELEVDSTQPKFTFTENEYFVKQRREFMEELNKPKVEMKKVVQEEVKVEPVKLTVVEEVVEPKKELVLRTKKQFRNLDLRQPSDLTAEQIDVVLKGTGLEGLGEAFVKAEEESGVNALYALSHAALESGWGKKGDVANIKNNIYGFQAYDDSPYESAAAFSSKEACILFVTGYIAEHYLTEGGQHHNGMTLKDMNVKYASDKEWASKIASIMYSSQYKILKAEQTSV